MPSGPLRNSGRAASRSGVSGSTITTRNQVADANTLLILAAAATALAGCSKSSETNETTEEVAAAGSDSAVALTDRQLFLKDNIEFQLRNNFIARVRKRPSDIKEACLYGTPTDQEVCIEGAVESVAHHDRDKAFQICPFLEGRNREICADVAGRGFYRIPRTNMDLYLRYK